MTEDVQQGSGPCEEPELGSDMTKNHSLTTLGSHDTIL